MFPGGRRKRPRRCRDVLQGAGAIGVVTSNGWASGSRISTSRARAACGAGATPPTSTSAGRRRAGKVARAPWPDASAGGGRGGARRERGRGVAERRRSRAVANCRGMEAAGRRRRFFFFFARSDHAPRQFAVGAEQFRAAVRAPWFGSSHERRAVGGLRGWTSRRGRRADACCSMGADPRRRAINHAAIAPRWRSGVARTRTAGRGPAASARRATSDEPVARHFFFQRAQLPQRVATTSAGRARRPRRRVGRIVSVKPRPARASQRSSGFRPCDARRQTLDVKMPYAWFLQRRHVRKQRHFLGALTGAAIAPSFAIGTRADSALRSSQFARNAGSRRACRRGRLRLGRQAHEVQELKVLEAERRLMSPATAATLRSSMTPREPRGRRRVIDAARARSATKRASL